jgi:hypothetical protein
MNRTTAIRPIPLALSGLIALFAALVALALAGGHDAAAHDSGYYASKSAGAITQKQLVFRNEMRRLWEDHVTWTRLAVISLVSGTPDTEATVSRLLRNQVDIGRAVAPYHGKPAGTALTGLLREHIVVAADLIAAAKAGDQAEQAQKTAVWAANADEIATFLSKANPRYWKVGEMKAMLSSHLRLTTAEVVARLQKRWAADVAAYDRIHRQALEMADMLSIGIEKQFPSRFR